MNKVEQLTYSTLFLGILTLNVTPLSSLLKPQDCQKSFDSTINYGQT